MSIGRAATVVSLVLLCVLALAEPAWAQSCGGSAGPAPCGSAGSEGSWLKKGQGFVRLSEEYEVKDRSYKHGDRVENDFDESLFISRTALQVRYAFTDDWTLDLTATYPHFTYRLKPPGGERIKQRYRGPGDTFLYLGRRIMLGDEPPFLGDPPIPMIPGFHDDDAPPPRPTLSLWAGVSLPTGSPEEPNPEIVTEDVSVSNLQTGSGTFDPLARARLEWPLRDVSLFAEASVRFPLYENRYDYRTADTEVLVVGADAPIVPKLSAGLAAMYQRTSRDQFDGHDVGVGGARWVYLVPSVSWRITDSASLDFSVRLPIYRHTETKLSDSSAVFSAGLTWSW